MKVNVLIKTLMAGLAVGALLLPSTRLFGDELRLPETSKKEAPEVVDVALDADGNLHGSFVDRVGLPLVGSSVVARQGRGRIHTAETDARGNFQVAGMKGGVWTVTANKQSSMLRVWTRKAAPPSAKSQLLLVEKAPVVRGQSEAAGIMSAFDAGTLFSVGAGVTGVTLGVIGVSESAAANDEAATLRQQLNTLSQTLDDLIATLN